MTTVSPPRADRRPTPGPAGPGGRPDPAAAPPAPPTHALTALLGAAAVLAGTLAIPPMVSGSDWFGPTAEVVLVIWLVGVGSRLARVPTVGVVLLQLVAAAIAMTALFTVRGYGGVIPNAAVLTEAGDLLTGAWSQIRTNVSPAPSSVELSFLICVSVSATAFIVDLLITVCRAPALVALPLLCLYAVPASIDVALLPWTAFAAPAVLYAMLLVADGLSGRRHGAGVASAQMATGLVLACVTAVVAVLVADSVTGIGTAGRLPRTNTGQTSGIGLSPFTSLEGNLQRGDPVDLLRISGLPAPAYLRTVGLQKWTPNEGWSVDQLQDGPLPDQPIRVGQTQVTVTPLDYRDVFLPVYNGVTSLGPVDAGWSFDSALESVHRADSIAPDQYQVTATFGEPSADELRADTVSATGDLLDTGDLRPEVVAQALAVTAGATTAFDKADKLRNYFTDPANGFVYSLDVPTGTSGDKLLDFLTNKQGFCEQYASAMAVMLRAVGVPARVAVGFTQGRQDSSGDYVVTSNDAHAWVEVPFDHAGWVEFDPTPLGNGQGGQQGFTDTTGQTTDGPTTGATTASTLPEEELGTARVTGSAATTSSAQAGGTAADGGPAVPAGLWWTLAIVIVLAAAVAGPTVVRRRRRERRLAVADSGGPGAAAAAWREVEDLAVDHGIALDPAQSARACANRLAKVAHLSESGRAQLRELVGAAERGWYAAAPASAGAGTSSPPVASSPEEGAGAFGSGASAPVDASAMAGSAPAVGATTARPAGTATVGPEATGPDVTDAETADRAGGTGPGIAGPATAGAAGDERLGDAPRTLAIELAHAAPLNLLDRLLPRSVRPALWRG